MNKMAFMFLVWIGFTLNLTSCGYNSLQGLDENVKSAWSELENQYQRRADMVPQLVQTVKGASKYEKETLESVINARANATSIKLSTDDLSNPAMMKKFQAAQDKLSGSLSRLLLTVEKYPELKALQNFQALQAQLEGTENRISTARNRYIESVGKYNKQVRFFPTNLTAKYILKLEPKENFTALPEKREVPKIDLDL